jgi:hypothetical protein
MDNVNHPTHYNCGPPDVECIDVIKWFNCNLANAMKYIWRCEHKGNKREDLRKAIFYLKAEIEMIDEADKKKMLEDAVTLNYIMADPEDDIITTEYETWLGGANE